MMDLRVAVLLLAGGIVAYIAYQHPAVGTAVLVGAGVVTLLYLLMMGSSGNGGPPAS
ncbi:hypothetical protein [Streptomyces sp. NPDC002215]|uniref:hypothetical protein n=1 Tax=Streptomyces sp. NPDC002215 TaxID=3154412 RepID=UPI00333088BC